MELVALNHATCRWQVRRITAYGWLKTINLPDEHHVGWTSIYQQFDGFFQRIWLLNYGYMISQQPGLGLWSWHPQNFAETRPGIIFKTPFLGFTGSMLNLGRVEPEVWLPGVANAKPWWLCPKISGKTPRSHGLGIIFPVACGFVYRVPWWGTPYSNGWYWGQDANVEPTPLGSLGVRRHQWQSPYLVAHPT